MSTSDHPFSLVALQRLRKQEELIRSQISAAVESNIEMQEHLYAVQDAMDHLTALLEIPSVQGSDLHTYQLLMIRLFNVGGSALAVGLSGYYQAGFQILRDALELVNLLDLFSIDASAVGRWTAVSDRKSAKEFEPFMVRSALEKHANFMNQRRDQIYALYSNMALHPTYKGLQLIAPGEIAMVGPFFNTSLVIALLEDLAAHLSHATLAASMLVADYIKGDAIIAKAAFIKRVDGYRKKYMSSAPFSKSV